MHLDNNLVTLFRQPDNLSTTKQLYISTTNLLSTMDLDFENNVKHSFSEARKHMGSLEAQIKAQNEQIGLLKAQIDKVLLELAKKPVHGEFDSFKPSKPEIQNPKKIVSSGNEGVFRQTDDRHSTDRQSFDNLSTVETLKNDLFSRFRSLTDREFNLFMLLYQLEEQKKAPITYTELAQKSGLSQSSVRDHISNILVKNIPIHKEFSTNRRVFLTIKPELRDLTLIERLLRLRQPSISHQATLNEQFLPK